jgi:hypothetical protein
MIAIEIKDGFQYHSLLLSGSQLLPSLDFFVLLCLGRKTAIPTAKKDKTSKDWLVCFPARRFFKAVALIDRGHQAKPRPSEGRAPRAENYHAMTQMQEFSVSSASGVRRLTAPRLLCLDILTVAARHIKSGHGQRGVNGIGDFAR